MITDRPQQPRVDRGRRPAALVALVTLSLLASASPASGAEGAYLALFHGPDDTGGMSLEKLRVALDGKDLPVPVPAADASPETALFSGTVPPGVHQLEVEASLEDAGSIFSYMDGYRIKLRSVLDVEVVAERGIAVRSRIVPKGGITTPWSEQNKLVLTLSAVDGPAAPAAAVAKAEPAAPAPSASPEPVPAPPAAQAIAKDAAPAPAADEGAPAAPAEPAGAARLAVAAAPPVAPEPPAAPPSPAAPAPRPAPEPRAATTAGACELTVLQFGFDTASLPDEARRALDRFASCVAATGSGVRVEGHSDSRGGDEYNRWLAWDRAASVSAYLRERGLADRRIATRSQGAARPLCEEATPDCFARNRRVEVSATR
jgi:outer membrane protein OmpA-like peptidoglycan-associated protein